MNAKDFKKKLEDLRENVPESLGGIPVAQLAVNYLIAEILITILERHERFEGTDPNEED